MKNKLLDTYIGEKNRERLKIFLEICADILFPKRVAVRELEMMSTEEILATAPKAGDIGVREFIALFRYHDPLVKKIVWEIKYHGNEKLVDVIGRLLCEKILDMVVRECLFDDQLSGPYEKILVLPIPISARRLKHRGFSQTKLVAEAIMKHIPKNLRTSFLYSPDVLVKIKETASQASLGSRNERLSNLSGSFDLADSENIIREKNIILIDDVITTGATMGEASGVLMDAGAKSVTGFGIAH